MSKDRIVHLNLSAKGGGEAVCIDTIRTLQRDHDVTLLTLTDLDAAVLNNYFNADIDPDALEDRIWTGVAETLDRPVQSVLNAEEERSTATTTAGSAG